MEGYQVLYGSYGEMLGAVAANHSGVSPQIMVIFPCISS